MVVTDIQMPPDRTDDGLRAAQTIRAAQPVRVDQQAPVPERESEREKVRVV